MVGVSRKTTTVCERECSIHGEYLKKYFLKKCSVFGDTCESSDRNHKSKANEKQEIYSYLRHSEKSEHQRQNTIKAAEIKTADLWKIHNYTDKNIKYWNTPLK